MGITKIILIVLFFTTIINFFYKIKKESIQKKKNKKSNRKIVENYLEKDEMAKLPSLFLLSDMKDYKKRIKDKFELTDRDYKDLVELPEGDKVKINLKKDWKYVLNNQIDSIDNDIDIKFTELGKKTIDSQFVYDLSININTIYEYGMKEFQNSLDNLINDEKEQYILDNTDFDNLFKDKDFDFYKEYEKNSKRYHLDGTLIKITDEPLDKETELMKSYNDELYTYESQCNLDKRLGSLVFNKNADNLDNEIKNTNDLAEDISKNITEYHAKYVRSKIPKSDEKAFKIVEYDELTEGLVNNFKEVEDLVLGKINKEKDLFLFTDTLKKIKNVNISNNFKIVDRKINYILKNTLKIDEYFYNGEVVIYRERNHGIHIKIEALKDKRTYYITDVNVLGIVISDKIEKVDTITDNIMNPLYYKFKDKHVITKHEVERELAEIIDRGSIENFMYLFTKFKKIRSDRGIMVNDFELLLYTGKILLDIKNTNNFKKINEINDPSIYTRIFGS
tara:strand:- start:29 stop:1546 length:1518 start_codon:yes stop_codon:yes gene_type:complete